MAMNNRERVGKAFEYLSEGLVDPVDDVMSKVFRTPNWTDAWAQADQQKYGTALRELNKHDVQVQLRAITEYGRDFNQILSRSQQAYASELRETRNRWAHLKPFSSDDAIRALSTIEYLLNAVSAPDSAADVRKLRDDLQRTVYEDHTRKISQRKVISIDPIQGMKPWREVIRPHKDVASGRFTASEFAADLWQVAVDQSICVTGNAYGDPVEFFNRTYLTEGLRDLLTRAIRRLVGDNSGSPVVNLQTNFGGGKTHSLLALYHLFGNEPIRALSSDVQNLAVNLHAEWKPGSVRRVALVGTKLNVAEPDEKYDGTLVHTIWGELAWQLGGREAYDIIAENDRAGKNPGHLLDTLLRRYAPCLILIDEWVAYAKQLVGHDDLPAGTFDDQFVFAQTLTEAVSATPHCMLVVSISASETGGKGNDTKSVERTGRRRYVSCRTSWAAKPTSGGLPPVMSPQGIGLSSTQMATQTDDSIRTHRATLRHMFVKAPTGSSGVDNNTYEKRIISYPFSRGLALAFVRKPPPENLNALGLKTPLGNPPLGIQHSSPPILRVDDIWISESAKSNLKQCGLCSGSQS